MVLVVTALLSAACAGGRFVRPTGTSAPFPDGLAVWTALSSECRTVAGIQAELRVSGRVNGRGFPSLTTGVGVERERLALIATAGARQVFTLAGRQDDVVLVNHVDRTTTRGAAAEVVDALVGVRLTPARLLGILSGCVADDATGVAADRVGAYGRVRTAGPTIYLRDRDGQWQLAAAEFDDMVVDYRRLDAGVAREIEIRRGADVSLRLRVIEFVRNPPLPEAVFSPRVPEAFVEISVDELRRSGSLAGPP